MPRRAKIALVAAVLVAGLLLALQFRKSPKDQLSANKSRSKSSIRERAGADIALASSSPSQPSSPVDLSVPTAQQASQLPVARNEGSVRLGANDPRLPADADASAAHAQSSSLLPETPSNTTETPDHTAADATAKPAESAIPRLPPSFSGIDRQDRSPTVDFRSDSPSDAAAGPTHKVVDGDSLPSLAERYLGSAGRSGEIFACNRDVLSDPELLPIGVRLRIPTGPARHDLATAPPTTSPPLAVATSDSVAPQSQPTDRPQSPLLLDIGSSGLSPLPPIGAQAKSPGRIYIVQTGDTLPGIAKSLYGDSARTEALLQANRGQLRSELDLRPGMMLECP